MQDIPSTLIKLLWTARLFAVFSCLQRMLFHDGRCSFSRSSLFQQNFRNMVLSSCPHNKRDVSWMTYGVESNHGRVFKMHLSEPQLWRLKELPAFFEEDRNKCRGYLLQFVVI
ncbi:hypothetical protein CEXT_191561 [Caerostris extrusa]|uniref:Secreted protein n=1 Tax=Caerostris extrusa TaxID=172846 RepID=A0AAV4U1U2_CAEEX|nr:hypothetical protein CEXT_191561 [Caerostris extrusa]